MQAGCWADGLAMTGSNKIDYFVEEMAQQHLKPSAPADKADILRRVSLDLTGVPPPQAWADAYLHNDAEGAYEQLVDSLCTPRYGKNGRRGGSTWHATRHQRI